jgi:hypothetical protein
MTRMKQVGAKFFAWGTSYVRIGSVLVQWGAAVNNDAAGNVNAHSSPVLFPVAFASAPWVLVSGRDASPVAHAAVNVTAAGFTLYGWWTDGSAHTGAGSATWIAIGAGS